MSAIQELQVRLQSTNALIARYRETLELPTTTPLEAKALRVNMKALENLAKRLEDAFLELAAAENLGVYKYRLLTGEGNPSLGGIGEAWSKLQALYATVYQGLTSKLSAATVLLPQLGFAYSFAGSVGVVVTLPPRPVGEVLLTGSPVEEASEIVFNLIESKDVQQVAERLGLAPIQAMNDWLDVHVSNHYGFAIEWQEDRVLKRRVEVDSGKVAALQAFVRDTKTRQTVTLTGLLNKVDDKEKTFRIVADNGDEIEGRYGEDVIKPEHAASVPARCKATILTVTEMIYSGKRPKPEIILEKLDPL